MLRLASAIVFLVIFASPTLSLAEAPKKATGKTILKLRVEPPSQVFIDGKAKGSSAKLKGMEIAPGTHTVRVVHNRDEHEERVTLKKGETFEYEWKFEDEAAPTPKATPAEPGNEQANEPAPDAPAKGGDEPQMPNPPPERPNVQGPKAKTRAGSRDPLEDFQPPEYAREKPVKTTSAKPINDKAARTAQWTRGTKGSLPKSRASTAAKSKRRASTAMGPNWKVASSTNK